MPSKQAQLVVGLALAAAVAIIGLAVAAPVVTSSTGTVSVTNETVTASSETIDLNGYNIDPATVVVYGYNDSSGSYETTNDYTLSERPGEIQVDPANSTLIDDGETVKITYDYQATDGITSLVTGYLPLGLGLVALVVLSSRLEELM